MDSSGTEQTELAWNEDTTRLAAPNMTPEQLAEAVLAGRIDDCDIPGDLYVQVWHIARQK